MRSTGRGQGPPEQAIGRWWIRWLAVTCLLGGLIAAAAVATVLMRPRPGVESIVVHSVALGRDMPVQIYRPPSLGTETGPLPILYLFHGRGGDEASWFGGRIGEEGVGIDALAADLIAQGRIPPVIIASARIDDSYGVDSAPSDDGYSHGPYERYIVDELVAAVEAREPALATPTGRFIGGYSMGGFAALHAAFRHPTLFGGVAALSPAISLDLPATREWLYPDEATRIAHDPLRLALTAPIDALPIFLGRGENDYDWIIDATDALAAELAGRGVDVSTGIVPGGHEAGTWRALVPAMLAALLGGG